MLIVKRFIYCLVSFAVLGCVVLFGITYWHCNTQNNFRNTQHIESIAKKVDVTGLENLRISGSGMPIFSLLKKKLDTVTGRVYIVDLTEGNNKYYKKNYSQHLCNLDPASKGGFQNIKMKFRQLYLGISANVMTEDERDVAEFHGFSYLSLKQKRRELPDDSIVDNLINFIKMQTEDTWIHIHCYAGKGRTTLMMAMVDILKNGKIVSLEDIVKRHRLIGGVDLFDTSVWKTGTYTQAQLVQRKELIKAFYQYVNDPQGYEKISWKAWCKQKNLVFKIVEGSNLAL